MKHKDIIAYKRVSATGDEFVSRIQHLLQEGWHLFNSPIIRLEKEREEANFCSQTLVMYKEDFDLAKYW